MKKSKFSQLAVGDRLSEMHHYTVVALNSEAATLRNEKGFEYDATVSVVEEGMYSASQFDREESVSRTRLIEILENSGGTVFCVNFNKKPTHTTVQEKLEGANVGTFSNAAELRQLAESLLLGEERTLIGYLVQTEPKLGRSQVVDMEVSSLTRSSLCSQLTTPPRQVEAGRHALRLVDHRTINWIILKNVKYVAQ